MSHIQILLALLAITAPMAAATLWRIRRLEIRVLNGLSHRLEQLERAVFEDVRGQRDDGQ